MSVELHLNKFSCFCYHLHLQTAQVIVLILYHKTHSEPLVFSGCWSYFLHV